MRRSWSIVAALLGLLVLVAAVRWAFGGGLADALIVVLAAALGIAAWIERRSVVALDAARRAEAESFARILRGLSRSVSPDAIVGAIVEELGLATDADHVVVVRRRPTSRLLEATLVSRSPGVATSTTLLPIADLDDPAADDTAVASRIATRVRAAYGLRNTLPAPIRIDGRIEGAIVLSRRGRERWTPAAERMLTGAAVEASAALARVYSHQAAEARASTDALTGLPNRRYFDEYVAMLARRRRAEDRVGVLMIDIDHFKAVNDTHGHAVGDDVLRAVGGAIAQAVREDDVPARFGGEEFSVLLRNPSPDVAIEVAERVRRTVAQLDLTKVGVPSVSVSVGVAVARKPDSPLTELIEAADGALYEAKRGGRDRVVAA